MQRQTRASRAFCRATSQRAKLLFHMIVCPRAPGTITFGRPAYTHFIAVSRALKPKTIAIPDVIDDAGVLLWNRGIGMKAVELAVKFARDVANAKLIVD